MPLRRGPGVVRYPPPVAGKGPGQRRGRRVTPRPRGPAGKTTAGPCGRGNTGNLCRVFDPGYDHSCGGGGGETGAAPARPIPRQDPRPSRRCCHAPSASDRPPTPPARPGAGPRPARGVRRGAAGRRARRGCRHPPGRVAPARPGGKGRGQAGRGPGRLRQQDQRVRGPGGLRQGPRGVRGGRDGREGARPGLQRDELRELPPEPGHRQFQPDRRAAGRPPRARPRGPVRRGTSPGRAARAA